MRRVAVFVDAGYFWVQVSSLVVGSRAPRNAVSLNHGKLRDEILSEVGKQFPAVDLLRVYWYDGPGPHGKTSDHASIDSLDDFKLRLGSRNGVGQQKAVDGLIIADMISLTQTKAITDALLVTGDADLTPGVVAAQAMGLRVHLLSIGSPTATSPHLANEVDRKTAWQHTEVANFATLPTVTIPAVPLTVAPVPPTAAPLATASVVGAAFNAIVIASAAHSSIKSGVYAPLLMALSPSTTQIPPDIDKELLRSARNQIHRVLTESEKRLLRAEFKNLL